ncbi:MAG: cytochrome C [Deltaproteobacteria bacterium]|nr:cytochrome C [Deltaproteobacteria bacterium]
MRRTIRLLSAGGVLLAAAVTASAGSKRVPLPPAYAEECGACHVAYPARMLDAASWNAVIGGLERHFGVDASADAATLEPIRAYLLRGARSKPTAGAGGQPLLRITETRWFRHEHDELPSRLVKGPAAPRPADCGACHRQAASGSYSERSLRLPGKEGAR